MTKKLDFDFKHNKSDDAFYVNGKRIFKGTDKSLWMASKLKELCQAVDEIRGEQ